MSAAYWTSIGAVMLLNAADTSLQLSVSKNKMDFNTLPEPLIPYDAGTWKRPAPTELYAYPAMIADKGLNNISHKFLLAYMYIPPGQDFTQRYLVIQEGRIDLSSCASFSASADGLGKVDHAATHDLDDEGTGNFGRTFLHL
ncbi:MAG: hypothetical protein WDN29_13165 [Methylovirgula sp.]